MRLLCDCLRRRGRRRLLHRRGRGLHRLGRGLLGAGLLGVQVCPDEADAHEREQAHGNDDGRRATVGELRFLWSRGGRVVGTSVSPQCVSPCAHGTPRRDQPRTAAGAFRYCRLVSSSSRPAWGQEQREVSGGPSEWGTGERDRSARPRKLSPRTGLGLPPASKAPIPARQQQASGACVPPAGRASSLFGCGGEAKEAKQRTAGAVSAVRPGARSPKRS